MTQDRSLLQALNKDMASFSSSKSSCRARFCGVHTGQQTCNLPASWHRVNAAWAVDRATPHSLVIKSSQLDGLEVLFFDSFRALQPIKNISLPGCRWLRCVCFFTSSLLSLPRSQLWDGGLRFYPRRRKTASLQKLESISVSRYLGRVCSGIGRDGSVMQASKGSSEDITVAYCSWRYP